MLRWCLLALVAMGCSSSKATNHTTIDGASKQDPSDSGVYTSDNSQCPVWPIEKLFPTVGPFFYGPDVGPCSATQIDRPNGVTPKTTVINYTYSAGHPELAQTPSSATLVHHYEYTYLRGLLTSETDFKEGLQSQITYTYDGSVATYVVHDASDTRTEFDYTLDGNGYPKSIDFGTLVDGKRVAPTKGPARFVFVYENCKIQQREAFSADGAPYPNSTATFTYDDAGHVVDIDSPDREVVYDYACWSPDAGAN